MKEKKILALVLTLLTLLGALTGCGSSTAKTEAPAPASESDTQTAEPANALERVKAAGVLTVATSADYEPYEYVDDQGNFVGFDMDLIRIIGERMNLEVDIQDMSFESIVAAVETGKVDCGIAAMGETDERKEHVDFTMMYHQQANVFYVRSDSDITMAEKEDIVNYVVGVQSGSMLDDFLTAFVDEGKMDESNVVRYERIEEAMLDLEAGRVQVVLGDAAGMQTTLDAYDCKVIFKAQLYDTGENIIVGKNEPEMVAAMNEVIQQLKDDGTIQSLMDKYGIE